MSIATSYSRVKALRDRLRDAMVALGLVAASSDFEDAVTAAEAIQNQGAVAGTISSKDEVYTVPGGLHSGAGTVQIADAEKAKIVPANIRAGVSIMGQEGEYTGEAAKLQTKTVTPTKAAQDVAADAGYDALSKVTVEAIPANYGDVSNVTAEAGQVLANKIFVGSDGAEKAGTMPNNGSVAGSIDGLTVESYTIPAGYHDGTGTISLTDDIEKALDAL